MRIRAWGAAAFGLALALAAPVASYAGSGAAAEAASQRIASAEAVPIEGRTLLLREGTWAFEARRQPEPTAPPARARQRRERPNTISLGFQGQYGAVRGNSRIADGFDQGAGYAFRFRYMLSSHSALGFSFEHQRFGSIQPPLNNPGAFADSHTVVTTVAAEGVFFIHREREFNPYFLGGFGFATPDIIYTESQAARSNEGLFATVGTGFERFVRPRFSIDVSIRGYASISNSEVTTIGQIAAGIHLYPGD